MARGKAFQIIGYLFLFSLILRAAPVSVAVKDPSGAVVADADITIAPSANLRDVPPGKYKITVSKAGFQPATVEIEVKNEPVSVTVELKIAAQHTTLQVGG